MWRSLFQSFMMNTWFTCSWDTWALHLCSILQLKNTYFDLFLLFVVYLLCSV